MTRLNSEKNSCPRSLLNFHMASVFRFAKAAERREPAKQIWGVSNDLSQGKPKLQNWMLQKGKTGFVKCQKRKVGFRRQGQQPASKFQALAPKIEQVLFLSNFSLLKQSKQALAVQKHQLLCGMVVFCAKAAGQETKEDSKAILFVPLV